MKCGNLDDIVVVNSLQPSQMESTSPIEAIVQLIEEASSAVMAADLEDLTGLATAHTCFQQIAAEAAASSNSALRPRFEPPSLEAGKIVEQLILRELPDPDAALRSLAETVRSLQALVHEAQGLPATHSPASPATPTAPAAPAASAAS